MSGEYLKCLQMTREILSIKRVDFHTQGNFLTTTVVFLTFARLCVCAKQLFSVIMCAIKILLT